MLLVVPTVPVFYSESEVARRFRRIGRGTPVVEPSTWEQAITWFYAIGSATTTITIPWALVSRLVESTQQNRRKIESDSSSIT